ncbi:FERM central domain protein [Necator americanus]|uniref:FERM central domain protein n=1 Tax=Necator americanus TaxID=51031 RepID=W2T7Q0_NECAM|nr:FERM central domain protein [Necator americanus]ETN77888.1 FERM central domain protein [Necator americanus]
MAHLVVDGLAASDGSWSLPILVTDMNIQRNLYVRGDLHIGGLMMRLVDEIGTNTILFLCNGLPLFLLFVEPLQSIRYHSVILITDVTRDWSDHALWWPEKRRWLQHTRSTLDQCGVTADSKLEFTPMHKDARVQLPDNQIIEARLDFSVNAFKATQKLCRDLGIRHSEELGLKRLIPPEILRKGTYEAENSTGPQPIRPGELNRTENSREISGFQESVGPMTLRKATPIFASQTQIDGRVRRGQSPALSTSGHIFNAHEMGTLPRHGTLPRGASPSPGAVLFDYLLFRSLMEQGVFEGDVVLLRFKYMTFFDLNPKYDPVRINQLYEQAKWSILLDEFDHTEEEASLFAALQLQATLQRDSPEPEGPAKDDVDMMLDELEQNLDAAALGRRSDLMQVPELADYLKYMKPKKLAAFKGFKRAFFSFRDLYLSYYQSSAEIHQPPLGHFSLKGCEVSPDVSVSQGKYHIKLLVPTAEGMTDFVLKCDTEHQYARWMAACRLASRGKSMADSSYPQEVESIKNLLHMQTTANGRNENSNARRATPVKLPSDFNVEEYVSQRYVRKARSKQGLQQRVADAHANVRQLTSTEAKLQYIRAWQALPEHGMHYFIVRFRNGRKADLIGVAINRLVKMNMENGESIKTWRFSNMKKWHVNWEIRHLKIQFEDEDIEFKPLSADCKIVHEFIGGYIFLTMRSKEQNQTLNEELFHKLTGGWV